MFACRRDREALESSATGLLGGEDNVRARLEAANKSDELLKKSLARKVPPKKFNKEKSHSAGELELYNVHNADPSLDMSG